MALEKQISIDKIEVVENGIIQVRQITRIIEDGVELSNSFHRWSLTPNQDVSNENDRVKAIANAVWTPEVIAAYNAQQEANKLEPAEE
jgi:hypothetical protein